LSGDDITKQRVFWAAMGSDHAGQLFFSGSFWQHEGLGYMATRGPELPTMMKQKYTSLEH
jgi:hypothetical protein